MFGDIRIDVLSELYPVGAETIAFTIPATQIAEYELSPQQRSADDVFEIIGETMRITIDRTGSFGQLVINPPLVRESRWFNCIFKVRNDDDGALIFTGVLRADMVEHNFETNLTTITLFDSLGMAIDGLKMIKYTATDADNRWGNIDNRNIPTLFNDARGASIGGGMREFIYESDDGVVPDAFYAVSFEEYFNDFQNWEIPPSDRNRFYKDIRWDVNQSLFVLNLMQIWEIDYPYLTYFGLKLFTARINVYGQVISQNLIQPSNLYPEADTLIESIKALFEVGQIYRDSNFRVAVNPQRNLAETTLATGDTSQMSIEGGTVYARHPLSMDIIHLANGQHSGASILKAILTARQYYMRSLPSGAISIGKHISRYSPTVGGTLHTIADDDVFEMKKLGTFGDTANIINGLSILRDPQNPTAILLDRYEQGIKDLRNKYIVTIPDTYYNTLNLLDRISINIGTESNRVFRLTSKTYPRDGYFTIEIMGKD